MQLKQKVTIIHFHINCGIKTINLYQYVLSTAIPKN